jgi:hypothetical protein
LLLLLLWLLRSNFAFNEQYISFMSTAAAGSQAQAWQLGRLDMLNLSLLIVLYPKEWELQ